MEKSPDLADTHTPAPAPPRGIPPVLGCAILLAVLVLGVACVWSFGALAFEGQILFRAGQPDEIRVWLVDDDGMAGLGFSDAIEIDEAVDGDRRCYQHRVRFALWRGAAEAQPAEFCRCYHLESGAWVDGGACYDF